MRIELACVQCASETKQPSLSWAELTDSGLYHLVCPKGHESSICVQEQKFEMLYDLGVSALVDGYYREAVSAFASALERFYEFFIFAVTVNRDVADAEFTATWKLVSNQTERQLGAFLLVSLLERGTRPKTLQQDSVAFRNSVIHKGVFPTRVKAEEFGREVLALISKDLEYLKQNVANGVSKAVFAHVAKTQATAAKDSKIVYMGYPTTIRIALVPSGPTPTLDEAMARMSKYRERWLASPGA